VLGVPNYTTPPVSRHCKLQWHRLKFGMAVGDFHAKEISKDTITLETADGFQQPFPDQ
jgi:hypothetical protein